MIRSFRSTVEVWLSETLRGDVYISAPTYAGTATSVPIDPRALERLRNTTGVERVDIARSVVVDSDHGPLHIAAFDRPQVDRGGLYVSVDRPPAEIADALRRGAVLVSEPLANRLSLPPRGASLRLHTDVGVRTVPVVGVYHDYASSRGTVTMDLRVYRDWWHDDRITAASLKLADPAGADKLSRLLRQELAAVQQLVVRPNWVLRREVFEVFDRAFAITNALLLLATTVAGLGVLGALLALQLDRQRDLGILRAIGVTSRQLAGLIFLETGLMGGAAGLLALPTGGVLAMILVYIINKRAFGWTLDLQLDWLPFVQALGLAIAAALIAGLGPAWRMSRMPPAAVLRYE
jgi:putative ABC transport system permease protein